MNINNLKSIRAMSTEQILTLEEGKLMSKNIADLLTDNLAMAFLNNKLIFPAEAIQSKSVALPILNAEEDDDLADDLADDDFDDDFDEDFDDEDFDDEDFDDEDFDEDDFDDSDFYEDDFDDSDFEDDFEDEEEGESSWDDSF